MVLPKSALTKAFLATVALCALMPGAWATCTEDFNAINAQPLLYTNGTCSGSAQFGLFSAPGSGATADNALAMSNAASASSNNSLAIGTGAQATGIGSISIGAGNVVRGANSGAIGDPTFIDGDHSYAIGNNNSIALGQQQAFILGNNNSVTGTGQNVFVLGSNVTQTISNSVALGGGTAMQGNLTTQTAGMTTVPGTTIRDVTYTFAGTTPAGVVSVGSVGTERRIQNVAAGLISATSTDAINGSELFATNQAVEALVTGGAGPVQYSNPATPTTPNGGAVTNSVTLVGLGGPVTINNVAPGQVTATSTQAINGSQLFGLSSSVANNFGGGSHVNSDGSISAPNYTVGGQSFNNIGGALGAVNNSLTNLQGQIFQNSQRADQGAAIALAASGLRYDDRVGKVSTAGAVSSFRGQPGLAFGIGWTSMSRDWRGNVAATFSPSSNGGGSDVGVVAGISHTWN